MARLTLVLFGPMHATLGDRPVVGFESAKVRALLAYLALEAARPHSRDELAGLLWPEEPDHAARANLRNALGNLRQAIGDQSAQPPFLSITRETVQFNRESDYSLDVNRFVDLLAACRQHVHRHIETCQSCAQRLHEAVALYRGDLLSQLFLNDSPTFEEWALIKREQLHHQILDGLYQLTIFHERHSDYEQARRYATRQLELEPWREETHRQVMRVLALNGQRSAALAQFETCRRLLKQELNAEPAYETFALAEKIKSGDLASDYRRHNLPAALTPLIGRERELTEIGQLLENPACRLLMLTGPGGIGKTRLAVQAATDQVGSFADGVWLVELAALSDPALVLQVVATTLGLREHGPRPLREVLIDSLKPREVLLVLDNCEHLIEACARIADDLLRACPQLSILATSREVFHIAGETIHPVPPLTTPDPRHLPATAALTKFKAVQLFAERAVTVFPGFVITADNGPAVARVCHQLDGMPLAIELAAARLKTLSVEQITAHLDDRFRLLIDGHRTALPRQQTLSATIEWSYNLLARAERVLLKRLSIFAGSWTLEAAEYIGADQRVSPEADTQTNSYDVIDALTHLVDKSLVNIEHAQGQETRYRMLETIRQYAREKLIESGEEAALRQRHLDYYVQLAERAEPELVSFDQFVWLDRLETEIDNIRTALDWSSIADVESGLRLTSALRWYWYTGRYIDESCNYLSRSLQPSIPQTVGMAIRAKALAVLSELMLRRNKVVQAQSLAEESLALCRVAGDEQGETLALLKLAEALSLQGQADEAHLIYERCLARSHARNDQVRVGETLLGLASNMWHELPRRTEILEAAQASFRAHGHWVGLALTLNDLTQMAIWQGNYPLALCRLNESISLVRRSAALAVLSVWVMFLSGRLALREGDYARARVEIEESAQRFLQDGGQTMSHTWAVSDLGYVALRQSDWQRACHHWTQSLHNFRESNTPSGVAYNVEGLAFLAVQRGQLSRAARLFAWADATREAINDTRPPVEQADVDRDLAVIHAQLDDATFEAAQQAGRQMTMDEAIAYALEEQA